MNTLFVLLGLLTLAAVSFYWLTSSQLALNLLGKLALGHVSNPPMMRQISRYFPLDHVLKQQWSAILKEYQQVQNHHQLPSFSQVYQSQRFLTENDRLPWQALPLKSFGYDVVQNQAMCPLTTSLIKQDPRIKSAMFSVIAPGKHIPSHQGVYKGIYKYHLGLKTPDDCAITIAGQPYQWRAGKSLIFDGTYSHEVTNNSKEWRVILLLELFREELGWLNRLVYWLMSLHPDVRRSAGAGAALGPGQRSTMG